MTRENKLALVLGFGLILFVGILISDHFSAANRQEVADLLPDRPPDPLTQTRWHDPELIDFGPPPPSATTTEQPPLTANHITLTAADRSTRRDNVERISMGPATGQQRPTPIPAASVQTPPPGERRHLVVGGETLIQICRHYYGDGSVAGELARYNEVTDPNTIPVGTRLRIPPPSELGVSSAPPPAAAPPRPTFAAYTVRGGDTLSEIAQRLMGSARQWRRLYDLNRDVIPDPDAIRAGVVIKVPQDG